MAKERVITREMQRTPWKYGLNSITGLPPTKVTTVSNDNDLERIGKSASKFLKTY